MPYSMDLKRYLTVQIESFRRTVEFIVLLTPRAAHCTADARPLTPLSLSPPKLNRQTYFFANLVSVTFARLPTRDS